TRKPGLSEVSGISVFAESGKWIANCPPNRTSQDPVPTDQVLLFSVLSLVSLVASTAGCWTNQVQASVPRWFAREDVVHGYGLPRRRRGLTLWLKIRLALGCRLGLGLHHCFQGFADMSGKGIQVNEPVRRAVGHWRHGTRFLTGHTLHVRFLAGTLAACGFAELQRAFLKLVQAQAARLGDGRRHSEYRRTA